MAKAVSLTADDLTPTPRPAAASPPRGANTVKAAAPPKRPSVPSDELVPLQFRMAPHFVREFKMEAVKRDMKYNEFLEVCFQHFMKTAK